MHKNRHAVELSEANSVIWTITKNKAISSIDKKSFTVATSKNHRMTDCNNQDAATKKKDVAARHLHTWSTFSHQTLTALVSESKVVDNTPAWYLLILDTRSVKSITVIRCCYNNYCQINFLQHSIMCTERLRQSTFLSITLPNVDQFYKKLSYGRGTLQHAKSAEILSTTAQLYKKSHLKKFVVGEWP